MKAVPLELPALMRAQKLQSKARKAGFDWDKADGAFDALRSEIGELEEAYRSKDAFDIEDEFGDVLFSAVNVSRISGKDPEEMLGRSTEKFIARVAGVERLAKETGIDLSACSADVLNDLWKKVKKY